MSDGSIVFDTKMDNSKFKDGVKALKDELKHVQKELNKSARELDKLYDKQANAKSSEERRDTARKIREELEANEYLLKEQERLQKAIADKEPGLKVAKDLEKAQDAYSKAVEKLQDAMYHHDDPNSDRFNRLQEDVDLARQRLQLLIDKMQEYNALEAEGVRGAADTLSDRTDEAVFDYAESYNADQALADAQSKLESFISTVKGALSGIPPLAWKSLKTIGIAAAKGFATAGQKAVQFGSKFIRSTKASDNAAAAFGRSIFRLSNMFKMLALRQIMRSMLSGVKQGFTNLMAYSNEAAASINNVKASMSFAANGMAAAVAPLLNAVAPVLTRIIDLFATAGNVAARFFAILTGAKSYTVAKKQLGGVADAAGGVGDAAKAAAEELGQLASIDEINNIASNAGSGGGGGGGAGGGTAGMFDTEEVDSMLADLVNDGKWYEAGRYVAEHLNELIQTFDNWINEDFRPEGVKYAEASADFINGFVDGFNFDLAGLTVADGLNAIADIANSFLRRVNFVRIGQGIGNGMYSMFSNIDWKLAGTALSNGFNSTIDMWFGGVQKFFSGSRGEDLGKKIGEGFNDFFRNIHWDNGATALITGFNGVVGLLWEFLQEWDTTYLAAKFGEKVNDVFSGIDAGKAARTASLIVTMFMGFLITAVEATDWQQVGDTTYEVVKNIDWTGVATAFFEGIGAAFGGLTGFIIGFLASAWADVVDWFYETMTVDGEFTAEGFFTGIGKAFSDVAGWIYDNIFSPFITGFKKAFGINSPSTVMDEQGVFLIEGLFNGIKRKFTDVYNMFDESLKKIAEKCRNKWDDIKKEASDKWDGVKKTLHSIWDAMTQDADTQFGTIERTAEDTGSTIESAFNSSRDGITGAFSGLATWFDNSVFAPIPGYAKSAINSAIRSLNRLSFDVPDWVPALGGKHFGFNIPYLARGTVVPPNAGEFMAVLGDNKREAEVVSPLSIIEQAVRNVIGEGGGDGRVAALLEQLIMVVENKHLLESDVGRAAVKHINNEIKKGNDPLLDY